MMLISKSSLFKASKSPSLLHQGWSGVQLIPLTHTTNFIWGKKQLKLHMCEGVYTSLSVCSKPGAFSWKSCPGHKVILHSEEKFFSFVWNIAWKLRVKTCVCGTSTSSVSLWMENKLIRNSSDQMVKIMNIQLSLTPSQKILLFRFQCTGPACVDSFVVFEWNKVFPVQTRIKLMPR